MITYIDKTDTCARFFIYLSILLKIRDILNILIFIIIKIVYCKLMTKVQSFKEISQKLTKHSFKI